MDSVRLKELLLPDREDVKDDGFESLRDFIAHIFKRYISQEGPSDRKTITYSNDSSSVKVFLNKDSSRIPFIYEFVCEGISTTLKFLYSINGYATFEGPSFKKIEDCRHEACISYMIREQLSGHSIKTITLENDFHEGNDPTKAMYTEDLKVYLEKGFYRVRYLISSKNPDVALSDEGLCKVSSVFDAIKGSFKGLLKSCEVSDG